MAEGARITLEAVTKSWGEDRAVDEVDFEVEPGQFVILLGPSGCGKSTTLRMVAGLETVTSGRILIDGRDVTHAPPAERGTSMVFQSYALFPHLNVAENIVFGLKTRRVARAERERRLAEVAGLVGLTPYLARKPAQLSGGQRQRVALARAIVSENRICLMDEPLSNLDARLRAEMRQEIRALQQRLGMTVIYVTHDQVEAMSMGDRVLLMEKGRLVQDASPVEIYRRPATTFAAGFLGSPPMNLIPLTRAKAGAGLPGLPDRALAPQGFEGFTLGLRPEALRPARPGEPALPVKVLAREYLGADSVLHLALGEAKVLARLPGESDHRPGESMAITWSAEDAQLFDHAGAAMAGTAAPAPDGTTLAETATA